MASALVSALVAELRADPEAAKAVAWELLPHLPAPETPRGLVTIAEAAKVFDMSEPALRKHVQRGHVPSVRIGSRRLVDLAAIERIEAV